MFNLIENYLNYCSNQKRLNNKTTRAYKTDLYQFSSFIGEIDMLAIMPSTLNSYIEFLHSKYKCRTVKRKIASVKSFFQYLLFNEYLQTNPWDKVQCKFQETRDLPKTIKLSNIELLLSVIYREIENGKSNFKRKNAVRDAAICEMLFSTGMRVFELSFLRAEDVDLSSGSIIIHGKRSKKRIIQIGNQNVLEILIRYKELFNNEIEIGGYFFVNQTGHQFSEQSVRRMLKHYTDLAAINQNITPHMFRHTFATALLDADVNIRYIQDLLGHSSIHTTEIYTHVSLAKKREILCNKHPRNKLNIK